MDKDLERQEIDLLSKSMSTEPVQYLFIMMYVNKILDKKPYCGEAKSFWGSVFFMQDGARV